ncbi:MAG: monooxygenase [Actinobacteria bacterium 13_1_40CM_2_65_8]|nr:MAG: monooxygenase [Chloroflexi bacterium 13_1_40CM_65_17]OLC68291.1 MAG: monooxygenase [Actinobacteria bacterium 13_1_40CM_4_65_12]OLD51072.1 MAG: monooxygenase [Actinobacteria bacterium 13_1_40CM_2_65_8]
MDFGRPIQFGYFVLPDSMRPLRPLQLAIRAEELGIDVIGIQDHPYQRRFYDTWTLLTAIAMRTNRVSVFPDVANLPLRPPAMLAKAAGSLDVLSGGRVELGLGAGGFWEAIKAMGGPVRTPGEAVSALEEAIEVIRLVWSGGRGLHFDGKFYQLAGLNAGPVPPHPIGIWLGAYRPRMLGLVGRAADGWVPSLGYLKPQEMADAAARVDDAAREAGRDPAAIRRIANVAANLTADEIAELAIELGFDTFVVGGLQEDAEAELREFLENVAPEARELVAEGRESR